jgi:HAE1 family hydrophobic/amphiphilic exporter-1
LKDGDNQYDVQLRLDTDFRNDPAKLGSLLVPAASGRVVRVSDVAQLKSDNGPSRIDRYQRQRNINAFANLDNIALGEAVVIAKQKVEELNLKPGYQVVFTGSAKTLATASNDFTLAMLLAVAFIFMVLASQFNSVLHPLTIMTALPLSLPAGLLALLIAGKTLNVYSGIGMLMTVPLMIGGVRGTVALTQTPVDRPSAIMWIVLLLCMDAVFLMLALWTFEPLMTE